MRRYAPPITVILVFVAVTCRALQATITYDEAATFLQYSISPVAALFGYSLPNNHLVHSLFVWLSTTLMGGSEFAIRLPAYFTSLMMLTYAWRVTQRLGGNGITAMLVLAFGTGIVWFAVLARGYSLTVLLTLILFEQALYPRKQSWRILLTSLLLMLTMPSMLLLIAAVGAWALIYRRSIILPIGFGVAMAALFYIPAAQYGLLDKFSRIFGNLSVSSFLQDIQVTLFPMWPGALILGVGAAVGLYVLRRNRRLMLLVALLLAVPTLLAPIQFVMTERFFYGRNYLYLLGILVVLAGVGLKSMLGRYAILPALLVMAFITPSLLTRSLRDPSLDEIVAFIDEQVAPEGAVVLAGCCYENQLFYYLHDQPEVFDIRSGAPIYAIITPIDSLRGLLAHYDVNAECVPLDGPFETYLCTVAPEAEEPPAK